MSEKTSWPELTNINVDEAVTTIQQENSSLQVMKVRFGGIVTMDFRPNRVRVYFDPNTQQVKGIPRIG
jgi:hypothetical protein